MRLGAAIVAAAVLATAATACGSGSATSYPQFQKEATGVCLRYHRALAKLGPPTTLKKIARVARGAYRLGNLERAQLAQLEPPADAKDGYGRMIDGFAEADALLPSVWRAAARKNTAVARRLIRQGRAIVAEANRDAVQIGLSDCRRS